MPDTHALLSPSSSERWISCPPSVRMSEGIEEKPSEYAAEGTAAHSLCEYKLRELLGYEQLDIRENLDYYDKQMEECTDAYQLKTGLSRAKLSKLMEAETWMSAHKAVELGFADDIFGKKNNKSSEEDEQKDDEPNQKNTPNEDEDDEEEQKNASSFLFSRKAVNASLLNKLTKNNAENGHSVAEIFDRLDTIQKFI